MALWQALVYRDAVKTPVLAGAALLLTSSVASAATLQVGSLRTYHTVAEAASAARDGDIIELDAETFAGPQALARFTASNLTIRGVGSARTVLDGQNTVLGGKAIWIIGGANTTIENIEFSGAGGTAAGDANGAGIRLESPSLTVRNCFFHDNQEGILGGTEGDGEVLIEASQFERNGVPAEDPIYGDRAGYEHNIYIGHVGKLTVRYSFFSGAWEGHNIKSRAHETRVLYNRITDEGQTTTSYEIDLPDGGRALIIGNLIEQSALTHNPIIVTYAEESASNSVQEFYFLHNTVVNDLGRGTFVKVARPLSAGLVANNLFVGEGTLLQGTVTERSNLQRTSAAEAGLFDAPAFDYRLLAGSPAIDEGSDPGLAGADSLLADRQYVHPLSSQARPVVGPLDIGAYEYGSAPEQPDAGPQDGSVADAQDADGSHSEASVPEDAANAGPDAADSSTAEASPESSAPEDSSSGCGCHSSQSSSSRGLEAIGLLISFWVIRRRRAA